MIRPLRRTHLRVAIALALLIPALLAVAITARRDAPRAPLPAALTPQ